MLRRLIGRRVLVAIGASLLLYTVGGFLVAPLLLRHPIERWTGAFLGREVTLDRLRLNPYALSLTADGLQITDRDKTPLLHWERLYVDFAALRTLWRREWVFGEIRLIGAAGRLALLPGGTLNIDDIVARLGSADPAQPNPAQPPVVTVSRLRIEDSSLAFVDRSGPMTFTTTLGPVRIDLRDFTTRRDERNAYTFRGRTEAGETFAWDGTFSLDPLGSQGRFSLEGVRLTKYRPYYRGVVPFDIRDGSADLRSEYRVAWSQGHRALELAGASAVVRDLKLSEHDKEEIAVDAPSVEVKDASIDLITGAATIRSVATRGGHVLVRKSKVGNVNLIDMLLPFFQAPATPPARGAVSRSKVPAAIPAGTAPPVKMLLRELTFADCTLDAEDLSQPRPVRVRLDQIHLTFHDVDNVPGTTARGALDLRFEGTGSVHAEGDLSLVGLEGDLAVKLQGIDVRPLDPYVEPALDLRVRAGTFSADGHVQANLYDTARPRFSFQGDVRMDEFASLDGRLKQDLLRWDSVRMRKVDYSLDQDRLRIGDLEIAGATGVLAVSPDGRINLLDVLRIPQSTAAAEVDQAGADVTPPTPPAAAPTAPAAPDTGDTRIGRAHLARGRIRLVDNTMTPPATFSLTRIEGTLAGLSSRPGARADVHLSLTVDDTAPVSLEGKVDPLGSDQFTDLALVGKGIDLAPLGPYSARYLGYALDRARLDLEMRYKLESRALHGTNVFTANPFLLGEKTGSPDATHLPVKLGLALLRDRHGVVSLDVPVEGSLDDPKFRLGRVILHALVNVFTKLVTSPFRLLARAFAGHEDVDLSVVDFAAGSSALPDEARTRLDAVSKGLAERPGLTLGIAGAADPAIDTEALRHAKLEGLVRAEKWHTLGRREREAVHVDDVVVNAAERPKYLKAAWKTFRDVHPDARQAPKPETPEEMEARMLAGIQVGADDLSALAAARAQAVHTYISGAGVASERLFTKQASAPAPRVTLELQ
jgi:uncharacterized protein DUF748